MRMKIVSLFAALLLVAACETTSDESGATSGAGTSAPETDATAGGGSEGVSSDPVQELVGLSNITPGTQEDLEVNVGDMVFFDLDKSVLRATAQRTLDLQAAWIKRFPGVRVKVEGHCDERGTTEYNLALGDLRASAVKRYLVAKGVTANRIDTISYGKERPLVLGSNAEAWRQNRRAVSVVVRPGAS